MTSRWHNLVTETQFATELVRSGISRGCELPMNGTRPDPLGYDEVYPLNVGLYMYTSGLERLCKLALACHSFVSTGTFAPVRKYSHHLSKRLNALKNLDLAKFEAFHPEYLLRPTDEFGDDLVRWLERYSSGECRYEILDSLTQDDTDVETWNTWVEFCSRGVVSADVDESISIRHAVGNAVRDICNANDLESAAYPLLEATTRPLYSASAAVGLAMYRRARWAAEVLASVTYYTHEDLPVLREGVNVLTQTTDNFFAYEVAGISDREPVIEELAHHFETFVDREEVMPEHPGQRNTEPSASVAP